MRRCVRFPAAAVCMLMVLLLLKCGGSLAAGEPAPRPEPPRILQVYPSDGMQHVPVDSAIHIIFSEPMDEAATIQSVSISPAPQIVYPASWQFLNNRAIMIIVPAKPLRYSTTYRVVVSRSARDSQGAEMQQDYSWSFTTAKSPPVPAEAPSNGGFASGDLAGWSWKHEEAGGSRAASWAVVDEGDRQHALKITRPPTFEMGSCRVEQRLDSELPAFGLVFLSFDMRVDDYTFKEYTARSTYPLKVVLTYLDKDGMERTFVRAYYYHLPAEGGVDSFAEFVELGKWTSRSYNLSALVPRPARLKSIGFECSGWAWTTFVDDIKLVW
ncbi:MAG: Ig-like domain-containing protein [Bacillota bacterium]